MRKSANFSECRTYRYGLWRIWDDNIPYALFIGLNPSTADEKEDDNTIRRCIAFAKDWGYGGLMMVNLFAYRATKPFDMKQASDPVGPENDKWIAEYSKSAGVLVGAWGNHGGFLSRGKKVLELIPNIKYLKLNKTGHPAHPLYLKGDLKPIPFNE